MAALNLYLANAVSDAWQRLSEATQAAATLNPGGWVVSTGATLHSEFQQGAERAASTFTGTTVPDGTLDTTLKDAFRSENAYSGDFASGNWVAHFVVRAITVGGAQDGRVRFRLIKADADGSNATEITSGQQQGSLVSNVSTSADFDSTLTFNPGAFSITNQYLFFQVAWERTGAGGMTTSDIAFRTGSSSSAGTRFTTADFTLATITGTGALSSAAATTSGAGASSSTGAGALATGAAEAAGTGTVSDGGVSGTGALLAGAVYVTGAGTSLSDGGGALSAQASVAEGAGTSGSTGAGALVVGQVVLDGAGVSLSVGAGALAAGAASAAGTDATGALPLVIGEQVVQAAYLGTRRVTRVYLGETQL